jgi:hypothetical protein
MKIFIALALLSVAAPAAAQDKLFDAGDPAQVAAALREAGYKAELKKNSSGEPLISSAANGDTFTIEFYDCKQGVACGSFQFFSWYRKDPLFDVAFVNEWNAKKRFLKAVIDKDGDMSLYLDVTAVGRITQAAFADWVDWYQVMDAEMDKFIAEKRAAKK